MQFLIAGDDGSFDFFNLHSTSEAWQQWKQYSCVERHGDHLWLLDLDGPDEGFTTYVRCGYCEASLDCMYPDASDLVYGTVEVDGKKVEIEAGWHSFHGFVGDIPVSVELEIETYFNPLDMIRPEYDVYLVLSSRS